jgi:nucleobase:cation symporter-1, NCS1 family
VTSIFVYTVLSLIFPARESEVKHTVYGHEIVDEGMPSDEESAGVRENEKGFGHVEEKKVMGELS